MVTLSYSVSRIRAEKNERQAIRRMFTNLYVSVVHEYIVLMEYIVHRVHECTTGRTRTQNQGLLLSNHSRSSTLLEALTIVKKGTAPQLLLRSRTFSL